MTFKEFENMRKRVDAIHERFAALEKWKEEFTAPPKCRNSEPEPDPTPDEKLCFIAKAWGWPHWTNGGESIVDEYGDSMRSANTGDVIALANWGIVCEQISDWGVIGTQGAWYQSGNAHHGRFPTLLDALYAAAKAEK